MRAFRSIALAVVAMCLPATAFAAGVTWSPPLLFGASNRTACQHALASSTTSSGPALHGVYRVADASSLGAYRVFYRRSLDGGATWPTIATMTANPSVWKMCPTVAAWGNLAVVAWLQGTASGAAAIRLRVSLDGGRSWATERRVPAPRTPGNPSIAVTATAIHVAWTDQAGSERWSRLATSRDRGATWTTRTLDAKPSDPFAASTSTTLVAASGTRVFAAWIRAGTRQIVGRASTNGGASWAVPQVLAAMPAPGNSYALRAAFSIAARPDRMALGWSGGWPVDPGHPELFVRVFAAGTWGSPTTITASADPGAAPYGYFSSPAVTLLASTRVGVAAIVCTDARALDPIYECGEPYGGEFHVTWSESIANGAGWTTPVDVNGGFLPWVDAVSAVWTSASSRALLADWATGETEWRSSVYFYRGTGSS